MFTVIETFAGAFRLDGKRTSAVECRMSYNGVIANPDDAVKAIIKRPWGHYGVVPRQPAQVNVYHVKGRKASGAAGPTG